jgi:hypothetical protein
MTSVRNATFIVLCLAWTTTAPSATTPDPCDVAAVGCPTIDVCEEISCSALCYQWNVIDMLNGPECLGIVHGYEGSGCEYQYVPGEGDCYVKACRCSEDLPVPVPMQ